MLGNCEALHSPLIGPILLVPYLHWETTQIGSRPPRTDTVNLENIALVQFLRF